MGWNMKWASEGKRSMSKMRPAAARSNDELRMRLLTVCASCSDLRMSEPNLANHNGSKSTFNFCKLLPHTFEFSTWFSIAVSSSICGLRRLLVDLVVVVVVVVAVDAVVDCGLLVVRVVKVTIDGGGVAPT